MAEFKVGDRVRFRQDGDEGVVTNVTEGHVAVNFEGDGLTLVFADELDTVESPLLKNIREVGELAEGLGMSSFEQSVRRHIDKIADLLIAKNKAYGDSALNPVRVFSKSDRTEQLNVRIDDKISRIQRGTEYGDEDTVRDLIGYLILKLIAEESE